MRTLPIFLSVHLLMSSLPLEVVFAKKLDAIGTLSELIDYVESKSGAIYLFPSKLAKTAVSVPSSELQSDQLDQLLSISLYQEGYTRIQEDKNIVRVIPTRDVRYDTAKIFDGKEDGLEVVPNTYDYFSYVVYFEHPDRIKTVARNIRPFVSRYGRVIDFEGSGRLILADSGKHIKRLVPMIKKLDVALSDKERSQKQKKEEFQRKLQLEKAKNCTSNS